MRVRFTLEARLLLDSPEALTSGARIQVQVSRFLLGLGGKYFRGESVYACQRISWDNEDTQTSEC